MMSNEECREVERAQAASERRTPTDAQPKPIPNLQPAVQDLVIGDIHARKVSGMQKYGTALQAFNGRNAVIDAYQEALDLAQYLRQVLSEDNQLASALDDLLHSRRPDRVRAQKVLDAYRAGNPAPVSGR